MNEARLENCRAVFRDCLLFLQAFGREQPDEACWERIAQESIRLTEVWRGRPEYRLCCDLMEAVLYELAR